MYQLIITEYLLLGGDSVQKHQKSRKTQRDIVSLSFTYLDFNLTSAVIDRSKYKPVRMK